MLANYGVLIGTYDHSSAHQGQWLHELLYVGADGQTYECAVDVNEPTGIFQYMVLHSLDTALFQNVSSLPDGYHDLTNQRVPGSGAIDYIRSPFVQRAEGCLAIILTVLNIFGTNEHVWNDVTGDEAGTALVALVTGSTRVYVFGAPYPNPVPSPGMHDIHMNQGDPVNSPFHALDGIWQDGCVILASPDGKLAGYFGKFASQSLHTDSNGFPN